MRDKTHEEHIIKWALFVKNNPKKWKSIHTEFINAQFEKAEQFYKELAKTKGGKEKIIKALKIRNIDAYPSIKG